MLVPSWPGSHRGRALHGTIPIALFLLLASTDSSLHLRLKIFEPHVTVL